VRPRRSSGVVVRPLNFTVREQQLLRYASLLFAGLIALVVFSSIVAWINGLPVRTNAWQVGAVATYLTLSVLLWRRNRPAAVVGVIVATAGLLLVGGAIYFLWPIVATQLYVPRQILEVAATMIGPVALNLAIIVVLVKALLSNNRWRGP
jgi:hypothetical protein